MRFTSLHTHSTFSYGDGFGPVEDHIKRVAQLGMKSLALTEHGNTSSHAQLEKAAKKHGIKPIYGLEAYTAPTTEENKQQAKWHQTILAMNTEGYRNLNRIVSRSWAEGFYYYPTVNTDMLKEHNEGLIVTSGCADSLLSCTLLGGKSNGKKRFTYTRKQFDAALRVIEWYQSVFGDRYYIEVQRFPGLRRARVLNPAFEKLSKITGARLVATADVHYPMPEDNAMQKILHAAHRGSTVEVTEASWEYDILLTYPLSDSEIVKDLIGTGLSRAAAKQAVLETERIAARCSVELPKNEPIKWHYDEDEFDSIEEYTWEQLRKGWVFRYGRNKFMQGKDDEYHERLKYEMDRIIPRGFCDYFAMLSYLIVWAKERKIAVGPARGSAAASLVCYLLRITEVDPMQFPTMVFERFIDPKRLDLPDVDIDFADDRRDEVRMEAIRVFGADRVGNIGNFTRYRGKNSIDDVARVYNIPNWETVKIKDLIIERSGGDSRLSDSLQDTFDMFPKAQEVVEKYPKLKLATRLEGNYRGLGVHAAGLVISNTPITDTCAVYTRQSNGREVSVVAYDKKDAEYLGMLKADFLGLKTMGAIGIALEITGIDLEDLYSVPLDEPDTLAAFKANDVTGIFQFEGRATRLVCSDVSPDHFMHLADINALSRPGPLFSGMTAAYVEVRHGRKKAEKLHPIVDAFTANSYGQIVYQEQVLGIIRDLGGFPVQRVGDIRKIISQKLGEASFQEMYQEFEAGATTRGCTPAQAKHIWKFMVTSATYSFNIAHCISYSMLAFWLQWLKQHEPVAFYTAQLEKIGSGKKEEPKKAKLMRDAVRHNVAIKPPSILISGASWTADQYSVRKQEKTGDVGAVRAGYTQISGIGTKTAEKIMELRDAKIELGGTGFTDWADLEEVSGIGPKTIVKIVDFAEKEDPFDLQLVARILGEFRDQIKAGGTGLPRPTHQSHQIPKQGQHNVIWMGIARNKEYKDYIEDQRARTGDSLDEIMARMKDPHLTKSCVLHCYDDGEEEVYVRFNRWAFPKFQSAIEGIDPDSDIIIVTGKKREDFGISLHATGMIVISTNTEGVSDDADIEEDEEILV